MPAPQPTSIERDSRTLRPHDLVAAFGETPSPYLAWRIHDYDFAYRPLAPAERDYYIRRVVTALIDGALVPAGTARHREWQDGWATHIDRIEKGEGRGALVPGYFGKYPVIRWQRELIAPLNRHFEYRSLAVIEDWLFDKYLRQVSAVYEFGCGTGHNLLRVRDVNPHAVLWGLDWAEASQRIIARWPAAGIDGNCRASRFDLFAPDRDFKLAPDAAVLTVAALEQVGERFGPFIDYLLDQRPALSIHIEPIAELLDSDNLLDYLSLAYFKRRNYLAGFLADLRARERDGRLRIHLARRTSIGSLFIDGYSVVVWSPAGAPRP